MFYFYKSLKKASFPFFALFVLFSSFAENSIISKEKIEKLEEEQFMIEKEFYISEIDEVIFSRIKGKSFKENCTIPKKDLRYVHILHKNLEGQTLKGEIVCNKKIASILLDIFKELYKNNYPIQKVKLIDEYNADDEKSMSDNNSSCFNFRFISYSKTLSNHAKGLAVDINPLYNPYIKTLNGKKHIEPASAEQFADRNKNFPYKIDENDLCYKLFTEAGFEWGGNWKNVKDYQHFEYIE